MNIYNIQGDMLYNIEPSLYTGKKISLLGDSITTYTGYIPSGQSSEYDGSRHNVTSVNDTWWMKVINALKMELLINNSWSGTCVTTIRDSVKGENSSAMIRSELLGDNPDVILFYMGINDFNFEAQLGTYDGHSYVQQTGEDFSSAYAITLDRMMTKYPRAEIWCATLPLCERNSEQGNPEINDNGVPLADFNERIKRLALTFGAKVLDFAQCGLTYRNMSRYMSSDTVHPIPLGMSMLANQAIKQLDPACHVRYDI